MNTGVVPWFESLGTFILLYLGMCWAKSCREAAQNPPGQGAPSVPAPLPGARPREGERGFMLGYVPVAMR